MRPCNKEMKNHLMDPITMYWMLLNDTWRSILNGRSECRNKIHFHLPYTTHTRNVYHNVFVLIFFPILFHQYLTIITQKKRNVHN